MADEKPAVDPVLTDDTYVGVVPPDPNKPKQGEILKSREEQEGNVQAEGPKVIPPPENAPEPQVLVSQEEAALNDGEVSYAGPSTIEASDHSKSQQEISAQNSPQVADAPKAPAHAEALDTSAEGNAPKAAKDKEDKAEPEPQRDPVIGDKREKLPEPSEE